MAEELFEGFFRAVFALLKAVFRLIIHVVFEIFFEIAIEILTRILAPIFAAIGRAVQFVLRPVETLYRFVFERMISTLKWRPLAHLGAISVLVACGFCAGFSASLAYHAMQDTQTTMALER